MNTETDESHERRTKQDGRQENNKRDRTTERGMMRSPEEEKSVVPQNEGR